MTMSVPPHFIEIAFPHDSAFKGTELLLAVNLNEQPQTRLNSRSLGATTAGAQGSGHQPIVKNNVRSHVMPPSCVDTIHTLFSIGNPKVTGRRGDINM
jgi:hypothetical protein